MDDQDNQGYRKAAEALLARYDGDFIAVGASPVPVLMHMASLDKGRSYTYVPFTGFWLQGGDWRDKDIYEFTRIQEKEPVLMGQYQRRLHGLGLTPRHLAETGSPVNFVDVTFTGVGLASFADIVLEDAKSVGLEHKVAANIRFISLSDGPCCEEKQSWLARDGGHPLITLRNMTMEPKLWAKIIHSHEYRQHMPRVTAKYPPEEWGKEPEPAAPENLAAYNQLAASLGLAHLIP